MLTFEEAKRIGIRTCIQTLGVEFVRKYAATSSSAYGDKGETVFCFVGVDDEAQPPYDGGKLILTSDNPFPYRVSCEVSKEDGSTQMLECILPQ